MDPRTQILDRMGQPRRTAQEMFPLMELYEERSQTAAAFCAERGISQAQLVYWRRKYRWENAAADARTFVEISRPAASDQAQVEIMYPGGMRVRFFAPVSASYLAQLVQS